jgi:hypothetical protein
MITDKTISGPEDQALPRCLRQIEDKVGWGSSEEWSTADFERLGEQIAGETGVSLSVTTLKRVWGRVKYASAPTETTLNALAAFAGYASWRDCRNALPPVAVAAEPVPAPVSVPGISVPDVTPGHRPDVTTSERKSVERRQSRRGWLVGVGLVALLAGVLVFFQNHAAPQPLNPADFSFSSRPVTRGIPNSVVFRYDASASPTDSVFIQQSWDPRRRQAVPREGHEFTSIYYYPGFFKAKLLVGGRVVREHGLLVPSDGWMVAVSQEPVPVYFDPQGTVRDGVLHLPVAAIVGRNVPMQPRPPSVRYSNVRDLKGLRNDNFTFETRLRSDFRTGSAACQNVMLDLMCEEDMIFIPLCAKGCVANLSLYLAGHEVRPAQADLSGLGFEPDQWVTVRCEVRNRRMQLFVDGRKAYEATFLNKPARLVGVSYEFEGTGSVDYVRYSRLNGEVVYEDTFDAPAAQAPAAP